MTTETVVRRLHQAINDHDLDALVACFAADYDNRTPAHPARGFTGAEQVRRNWTGILGAVPDLKADLVACTVDGDVAWPSGTGPAAAVTGRCCTCAG
jgi:hypothetical protein